MQHFRLKTINKLAIPALISGISEPLLSLTDTAIIGHIPVHATEALAAVGIVGTFLSMLVWVLGQTRSALSAIIAQYFGANRLHAIKRLPAQAVFLVLVSGVFLIALTYPFTAYIFKCYNASGLILEYCEAYYKIRVFGFPFTLLTMAAFGTFNGFQNTNLPMRIAVFGAVLNVVLDLILVYGISGIIAPMHIEGAAYASVIAQVAMALLALYYLVRKMAISLVPRLPLHPELSRLLTLVLHLFVRTLALNVTLYFATRMATGYGENYIAAYTIAINLWFLGAFIIDGYAAAGQILSGKLFGAKAYKELRELNIKLLKIGVVVGCLLALLGGSMYVFVGAFFTKNVEVLSRFYEVFWIVLLMQPLCAVAFIFDGIFKGLAKMKLLRNVLLGATFAVFLPLVYLLDGLDLKLKGVFIAIAFWMLARTVPLYLYFYQKFTKL